MKKAVVVFLVSLIVLGAVVVPKAFASFINLSQYQLTLTAGSTASVTISSDAADSYYIAGNSASNIVSAGITSSMLTVYGINPGTSRVSVCTINNLACTNLEVIVVSAQPPLIGGIALSQNYLNLTPGRSGSVTVSYGGAYANNFYVSNSNPQVVTANISGSILNVYALNSGTAVLTISAISGNFGSAYLTVTVSNIYYPNYGSGSLINDNGTIYIVYKNYKIGFSNWPAFVNLGYDPSDVVYTSSWAYTNSSYVVVTATGPHPWGTWIKNGQTVYFVHESGLIPISTYDIFVQNGGTANMLVGANLYDFQKPILSLMTYSDPRLRN